MCLLVVVECVGVCGLLCAVKRDNFVLVFACEEGAFCCVWGSDISKAHNVYYV